MTTGTMPIVLAVRQGRQLTFWCPFCRGSHWHGAHGPCDGCGCPLHEDYSGRGAVCTCPPGAGNGHRAAHCWNPRSPFKKTGYILREVDAAPPRPATVVLTGWCRAGTPQSCVGCTPRVVRKRSGSVQITHEAGCTWMRAQLAGRPEIERAIEQAQDFVVVDGIRR